MLNDPKFQTGGKNPDGSQKKGYWCFVHSDGKRKSLTKHGAPRIKGRKKELMLAVEARGKWLTANEKTEEFERESEKLSGGVMVRDSTNLYLSKKEGGPRGDEAFGY